MAYTEATWFHHSWGLERLHVSSLLATDDPQAHNKFSPEHVDVGGEGDGGGGARLCYEDTNATASFASLANGTYPCFGYDQDVAYDLWDARLLSHLLVIAAVTFYFV